MVITLTLICDFRQLYRSTGKEQEG